MKKIFLLTAIVITHEAFSQQQYYDFKEFREKQNSRKSSLIVPNKRNTISKDSLEKIINNIISTKYNYGIGSLQLTQLNGNKMYSLPQDNMACIVPEMSQFNMPVAGTNIKITGMPPRYKRPIPILPPENK